MICERCKLTTADAELARNAGLCSPCRSEQDLAVLAKWELTFSDPPAAPHVTWVAYDGTQEMMDAFAAAGRRAADRAEVVAQATKATTSIYHTAAEESVAAVPIRAIRLVNNTSAAVRARLDYDGDVLVVTIEQ